MSFRLAWVVYERPLTIPLRTVHGVWFERRGIALRLEGAVGAVGYGEIAPLESFGSESLDAALEYLRLLGTHLEPDFLAEVPPHLPATAAGLGAALWMLEEPAIPYRLTNTWLLPTGEPARQALARARDQGFTRFKLKIGVDAINRELALVDALWSALPDGGRLRLDANGGLSDLQMREWMLCLEGMEAIEFLEQPRPPGEERQVAKVAAVHGVTVALDESICHQQDIAAAIRDWNWTGPLVLKTSLLGEPRQLLAQLAAHPQPTVVSSVFETGLGLHAALRLAARLNSPYAVGFGTLGFFDDDLRLFECSPQLDDAPASPDNLEKLWQAIGHRFALS